MEKKEVFAFINALRDYNFKDDDIVYYLVKIINCNLCPFRKYCINKKDISCQQFLADLVQNTTILKNCFTDLSKE